MMMGKTSGLEKSAKCAAAIAVANTIAKFGADDNTLSAALAATDGLIGIFQHITSAAGEDVRVMLDGISDLKLGGTVTRGDQITSDSAAKGVKATLGQNYIGYALASGVTGDIIPVLIAPGMIAPNQAANGNTLKGLAIATFDPSANSGERTVAKHGLGVILPDNAIVDRSWYEVLTTFTSATDAATIALGIDTQSEAGIKAAVAISNGANPYDAGLVEGIQTGAIANALAKCTADRELCATVAVEALTAGKLRLYAEYIVSV
ncbi:MAG: hypothetical protein HZB61_10320 [Nitrospirae bacterium]|nr:hypothetical protein [Nitrospirota bacterium]